ncbi:MMPL family transporter [Paenibacillus sp. UMB4589-SE434]|uniref:MMPL family transporter n=1 Tax=Paenibacillus sp. UMB4589-SE434 TaxID=3046314 RepID=UPI00254BFAA3|nr:MMPL family transporter [Paenibacillus sp. UMB4589-SE434]MDK8183125.1 MMPL family transporter [Paenibacillus sp. UMB4589-SE434]
MRTILKARWAIMAIWIVAAIALFMTAPSLSELVKEKGTIRVPDGYSSSRAQEILDEVAAANGDSHKSQIALLFHNPNGLSTDEKQEVNHTLTMLADSKAKLHIISMLNPFEQPELADKLISKDGKTILTSLTVDTGSVSSQEVKEAISTQLNDVKVEHYMTGRQQIDHDQIESSQAGLKKSESITVVFILLILFVVFRSFVAPFIPLLTVGLSYIVSQSIVSFLVDSTDFPLSTFTQIFMVAVLFGIGTDYCILLISRFKEELAQHEDTWEAIIATYRTAGKTVLFSGLAVLVGFSVIGLSQFILYRSAVAVAIGIAVMLLALVTVVPFFMAVLGKKLFWPTKGSLEHKESRIWGAVGSFSLKRPLAAFLIVAAVTVPFLITYSGQVSFNSLEEIGDKYESVKAFNLISQSFDPGESMPTQVVIKTANPLKETEYMALAEKMSREIMKVDGVSSVRSLSRPAGDEIQDFKVAEQVKSLESGLKEGNKGINDIKSGLSEANSQLTKNEPQLKKAASSTDKLTDGTKQLTSGITQLQGGLSQIQKGIADGSMGAGQLKQALQQAKASAQQLAQAHEKLLQSYQQLGGGMVQMSNGLTQMQQQVEGAAKSLQGLEQHFTSLQSRYPELQQDPDYVTIHATVTQSGKGIGQLGAALGQVHSQMQQISGGMKQANDAYTQAAAGQRSLASGLDQLIAGISKLESGLNQAAAGQSQIIGKLPGIVHGLEQLQDGQNQIGQGFTQLTGQLTQLTNGLQKSVDGLSQISGGLHSANNYLQQVGSTADNELGGWFVPEEVVQNKEFKQALDLYLSADRKVMTLDVVFSVNPYGTKAIDSVKEVQAAVDRAVKNTKLEQSDIALGGVSSTFADLKQISGEDYTRTVALMLIGILLILILLFRSIVMPLYIIASLLLTFFTSMGITELVFTNILGYSGVTWATPFFGFVMLMALGVDYSIFLMDRFNENKHLSVKDAILFAMRNMGPVIISAVIILGGTFASFYPSGVLSMMQIATVVLSGLLLYTFLLLPFFVPVMAKMFGAANWWPFAPKSEHADKSQKISA